MPGRDRSGPAGQGPLTGRGLGPCHPGTALAFEPSYGRGYGRGFGRGFGRGRGGGFGGGFGRGRGGGFGRGYGWYAPPVEVVERIPVKPQIDEVSVLREELAILTEKAELINKRIAELEKE